MTSRAKKTIKSLLRCMDKFDNIANINSSEIVNGGVSIRAFKSADYVLDVNVLNKNAKYCTQMVCNGCFHQMVLETRKASCVLIAIGCINVILSKRDPNSDIIITTLML